MEAFLIACGVLAICAVVFWCGMMVAERMYREREAAINYALRQQYARLMAGVDRDDVGQPYVSPDLADPACTGKKSVVSTEFQTKFNKHGRAVERIN